MIDRLCSNKLLCRVPVRSHFVQRPGRDRDHHNRYRKPNHHHRWSRRFSLPENRQHSEASWPIDFWISPVWLLRLQLSYAVREYPHRLSGRHWGCQRPNHHPARHPEWLSLRGQIHFVYPGSGACPTRTQRYLQRASLTRRGRVLDYWRTRVS